MFPYWFFPQLPSLVHHLEGLLLGRQLLLSLRGSLDNRCGGRKGGSSRYDDVICVSTDLEAYLLK